MAAFLVLLFGACAGVPIATCVRDGAGPRGGGGALSPRRTAGGRP